MPGDLSHAEWPKLGGALGTFPNLNNSKIGDCETFAEDKARFVDGRVILQEKTRIYNYSSYIIGFCSK